MPLCECQTVTQICLLPLVSGLVLLNDPVRLLEVEVLVAHLVEVEVVPEEVEEEARAWLGFLANLQPGGQTLAGSRRAGAVRVQKSVACVRGR